MVFQIPFSPIVIVFDDTSITLKRPVLGNISVLYDPVARRSVADVVNGGQST